MPDERTDEQKRIDAEVADKIMRLVPCDEWVQMNFGSAGGPAMRKDCAHGDKECYPTATIGGAFGSYYGCPAYSTNIKFAMEVVDRLVSDGHIFIVKGDGLRTGDHNPRWTILVDNNPRCDGHHLPEAICRAALAAINATELADREHG